MIQLLVFHVMVLQHLGRGILFAHSSLPPPAVLVHQLTYSAPTPEADRLFSIL